MNQMSSSPSSNEVPENQETTNGEPRILEQDVHLSESLIWRRQREFYSQRGLKAWTEDMVPNFATNNPFIAGIYARIVLSFVRDCLKPGEGESAVPTLASLRILEMGAGTGKFAFLFLRRLTALFRTERLPVKLRYCIADCSEDLVHDWCNNPYLAEFVDSGVLEFCALRADESIPSSFFQSEAVNSPVVVIANYVFDSLPQDAFVVHQGQISEALATTVENKDAKTLSKLEISFKNVAILPGRYADPQWNAILERYRTRLTSAAVPFPSHALEVLQEIRRLAPDALLVLVGDKGFVSEDLLALSQGPPAIEFHGSNCFSQMVNFDAIAKYFEATDGMALLPDKHFGSLNICAFLAGTPAVAFIATRAAYRETQQAFGPDDLFALMAGLNARLDEMSIPQILALLRLGGWDPITLIRLFPAISRQIRTVSGERLDLRQAIIRTFANHYPIQSGENVIAFYCGVILLELRFYDDALSMFKTSQQILGPSASTSFNLGLCHEGLGQIQEALACMIEACNLDPGFEAAQRSRLKLEAEISSKKVLRERF